MALDKSAEPNKNGTPSEGQPRAARDPMPEVSEHDVSALSRARQQAQNALLKARLEGRSARVLAAARQRAQRAADVLLAARLAAEYRTRMISNPPRRRSARR
jgi:hypothetical protein